MVTFSMHKVLDTMPPRSYSTAPNGTVRCAANVAFWPSNIPVIHRRLHGFSQANAFAESAGEGRGSTIHLQLPRILTPGGGIEGEASV